MGEIVAVMSDIDRLFHRLVEVLAARDAARLHGPIDLADLYQTIIPYRTNRTSLRFDTNQDYEMALLRLLAGERGYVEVEPPEVAAALAEEARATNPNPGAFRAYGDARARLNGEAVQKILATHDAYAPPDVAELDASPGIQPPTGRQLPFALDEVPVAPAPRRSSVAHPQPVATETCPRCSKNLPLGRTVNFCPHCGGNVKVRDCPGCGTQMDLEWRHCVTCGYRVT